MAALENQDNPGRPNRRPDEPPSPRVLKLALIAAAIILLIGILVYIKARHAPPALRDELQIRSLPAFPAARAATAARIAANPQIPG